MGQNQEIFGAQQEKISSFLDNYHFSHSDGLSQIFERHIIRLSFESLLCNKLHSGALFLHIQLQGRSNFQIRLHICNNRTPCLLVFVGLYSGMVEKRVKTE